MSAIGIGATVFFYVWSFRENDMLFLTGLGVTGFLIGLGLIINALLFTVPKQSVSNSALDAHQVNVIAEAADRIVMANSERKTAEPLNAPPSITEQTTHQLTDSSGRPTRFRESG